MRKFLYTAYSLTAVIVAIFGIGALGILVREFWVPGTFKESEFFTYEAMFVDLALVAMFGVQHSLMARDNFKQNISRLLSPELERSVYVLFSGFTLVVMAGLWRSFDPMLWEVESKWLFWLLIGVSILGYVITALGALAIDPKDLIGLRQVKANWTGRKSDDIPFQTPGLYKYMRHPIYTGLIIAFWVGPTMTADHFTFACGMTVYMLIAIRYEERDLVRRYGAAYKDYQQRVPMLVPFTKSRKKQD